MNDSDKTITEGAYDVNKSYDDEIYGKKSKISKETLTIRRTTVHRVLEAANAALSAAQAAGDAKEAAILQEKIADLNALLNSGTDVGAGQPDATKDDTNGETPKEDEKGNADADSSEGEGNGPSDEAGNEAGENGSDPKNGKDDGKIADPDWQDDSAGDNEASGEQHTDDDKPNSQNGDSSSDSSDDQGDGSADDGDENEDDSESEDDNADENGDKPNQGAGGEKDGDEGKDTESQASPDGATDKQAGDSGDSDADGSDETEDDGENGDGKQAKAKGKNGESSDSEDSEDDSEDDQEDDSGDESETSGDKSKAAESGDDEADSDEEDDEDEGDDDSEEDDDTDSTPGKPKIKDGKVLVNPFSRQVGQQLPPDVAQKMKDGSLQTEAEWDAVIRVLSKLKGDAKRGAKDALLDILREKGIDVSKYTKDGSDGGTAGANESLDRRLTEALKALEDMSDDEFNDTINKVFDEIDKVKKPSYSTDIEARIQEIKDEASNAVINRELDTEDNLSMKDDIMHAKARELERQKYSISAAGLKNLTSFKLNFYRAIKDQVDSAEDEDASWSAIDRRHEDDKSIIKKGIILDDVPNDIPSIEVYFDQSGSWEADDIKIGIQAISVINDFAEKGEIKLDIYYFSNNVFSDAVSARAQGGTSAWIEILSNLKAHKAKNAIIVTDSDMDNQARRGPSL